MRLLRDCRFFVLTALVLLLPLASQANSSTYQISDFGAVPDGATVNTKAIQAAIDAAAEAGGGHVIVGPGEWVTGTLRLKSNVILELGAGATLLGSTDLADYPEIRPEYRSYTDLYTVRSLIYAENVHNIGIIGYGTIDGQGSHFEGSLGGYAGRKEYHVRPYLIRVITCTDIRVEDITLKNSAMWMQHYLACDRLRVHGIKVFNHANYNNDMIDIDGCRDVIISDCIGDTDDDALTLKSTHGRPCENVVITNCLLSSHCNGLKMGTETIGGFRNITISNVVITPSKDRDPLYGRIEGIGGIGLMIVDGGIMEGILIENVRIEGTTSPLFMRLGDRGRVPVEGMEKPGVGSLRDVIIRGVSVKGALNNGCLITGLPDHPIENVTLEDIQFEFEGGGDGENFEREIPETTKKKYPESTMFGQLPAYGLYVRHLKGLTMERVTLKTIEDDPRPAIVFDDVSNTQIRQLNAEAPSSDNPLIDLRSVNQFDLRDSKAPEGVKTMIRVGGNSSGITLWNCDVSAAGNVVELRDGVSKKEVRQVSVMK